jgi:hypothetical protein
MTPTIIDLKPGRWCATALLVGETGRYLIQRRDGVRLDQLPRTIAPPSAALSSRASRRRR